MLTSISSASEALVLTSISSASEALVLTSISSASEALVLTSISSASEALVLTSLSSASEALVLTSLSSASAAPLLASIAAPAGSPAPVSESLQRPRVLGTEFSGLATRSTAPSTSASSGVADSTRSVRFCSMISRISPSESPEERVMQVDVAWPVSGSRAVTLTIPSSLISKVTSILTSPRRAFLNPENSNWPSNSFSDRSRDSP